MTTINTIQDLARELKTSAMTAQEIQALDATSNVCKFPLIAVQQLRSLGYQIAVTSIDATGIAMYQVSA